MTGSINEINTLIAKGKGVRGMFGSEGGLREDAFEEWKTSSQDFLMERLGEDSQFYKDFASRVTKASLSCCSIGIGVLITARKSLEDAGPAEHAKPVESLGPAMAAAPPEEPQIEPPQPERPEPIIDFPQRLSSLIVMGKGVRDTFDTANGVSTEAFEEWRACSHQLLSEEFGQDDLFFQDFANRVNEATLVVCNIGIGILLSVNGSLEESRVKRAAAPPAPATEEAKEPVEEAAPPEQPPVAAKKTSKRGRPVAATQKPGAELKKKKPARPVTKEKKAETHKKEIVASAQQVQPKPEEEKLSAPPHEKEIKLQPEELPVTATEGVPKEEGAVATTPPEKPQAPFAPEPAEISMSTVEALENLWWQAQVQLSQGHKDAAAVLCGGVSEVALRYLCAVHNIPVKEWDTMGDLNDKLLENGVYGDSTHKKFVSWWYLREDALAANYDAYNKNDVASMLRGVEGVLKQHLS